MLKISDYVRNRVIVIFYIPFFIFVIALLTVVTILTDQVIDVANTSIFSGLQPEIKEWSNVTDSLQLESDLNQIISTSSLSIVRVSTADQEIVVPNNSILGKNCANFFCRELVIKKEFSFPGSNITRISVSIQRRNPLFFEIVFIYIGTIALLFILFLLGRSFARDMVKKVVISFDALQMAADQNNTVKSFEGLITFQEVQTLIANMLSKQIQLESQRQELAARIAQAGSERALLQYAHDIMSPIGLVSIILATPDYATKSVDALKLAVNRIDALSRGLLSTYRKKKFTASTFSYAFPNDITAFISHLTPIFSHANISVNCELDKQINLGDFDLLKHVTNLLNNAVQAGAKNIRLSLAVPAPSKLTVSVEDDGGGMPAQQIDSILAGHNYSTKSGQDGLGLGLSSLKSHVEKSGGQFAVKSTIGKGTSFTITLNCTQSLL